MSINSCWNTAYSCVAFGLNCQCLSLLDSKLITEGRGKQKIDGKEAHVSGDPGPHLQVKRSKVKVSRPINAETENAPSLPKGRLTIFKLG